MKNSEKNESNSRNVEKNHYICTQKEAHLAHKRVTQT